MDEEFVQREHQKLVESLNQSDAAELERLGHHGIGGNLNRDKEADLSFQHAVKESALYKLTQPAPVVPTAAVNNGWNAHPLSTLFLALSIIILSGSICLNLLQKPIDKQPALVRPWPSAIAKVHDTVVHNGRTTTYDYTFEYKVAEKSYHFTDKGLYTRFDMSEVKYDPKVPNHYYRVPLDAEGIIPTILGFLGLLVGFSFAWDGIAKWRDRGRSNIAPTLAFIVLAITLMMLPVAFHISHITYSGAPYSVATTVAPK